MASMNPRDAKVFVDIFRKVFHLFIWPFLKEVISRAAKEKDPVHALSRMLKENSNITSGVSAVAGGVGGAAAGGAVWVASLGLWGGIGYSLGIIALPLWAPIAGALVGATGIGVGVYALLSKLNKRDRIKLAKLYAHALHVVVHADGKVTDEEAKQLAKCKEKLVRMGVELSEAEALFEAAPRDLESFGIGPTDHDPDVVKAVLTEIWLAAEVAESAGDLERQTFSALCQQLLVGSETDALISKARDQRELAAQQTPAVAVAAAFAAPDVWSAAEEIFDELLAADFSGNARRRRNEYLKAGLDIATAAASVTAVGSGHPEMLSVIGQGYTAASAALADQPEKIPNAQTRSVELGEKVGLDPKQVQAFLRDLEKVLTRTRQATEKEMRKKQQTTGR